MVDVYNLIANISGEYPLAQTVSISRIPCARCLRDSHQRGEIYILWKILPDSTTFVRYMANIYHQLIHQDDVTNRFQVYNLEVEQICLVIILARLIQAENDQYGDYI